MSAPLWEREPSKACTTGQPCSQPPRTPLAAACPQASAARALSISAIPHHVDAGYNSSYDVFPRSRSYEARVSLCPVATWGNSRTSVFFSTVINLCPDLPFVLPVESLLKSDGKGVLG